MKLRELITSVQFLDEEIYNISIEDRNVFVLCMDGHLYHHTALKAISDN